jgi:hypothetical protein
MNRLKDFLEDLQDPEPLGSFFEIESPYNYFAVSQETVSEIERCLDQSPPPRWVIFRDLFGARHRIPAVHVCRISEKTAAQRAASRAFYRARRLEEKMDRRPWEDDE